MNFFGIGPMELIMVLVIALIIFGPGKMPEIGKTLGSAIREFRRASQELTSEFTREVEISKLKEGAKAIQAEVTQSVPYQAGGVTVELDETSKESVPASTPEPTVQPITAVEGDLESRPELSIDGGKPEPSQADESTPEAKPSMRKVIAQKGAAKRHDHAK